jgi:hypothetical protein
MKPSLYTSFVLYFTDVKEEDMKKPVLCLNAKCWLTGKVTKCNGILHTLEIHNCHLRRVLLE